MRQRPPEQDRANLSVNRHHLLLASSAVATAPAVGTQLVQPAIAQTPSQRFAYPADRETRSAARALALESLLIEKGIITGNTVNTVLSFFETQMGPFNGAKIVARDGSILPSRSFWAMTHRLRSPSSTCPREWRAPRASTCAPR
jgi:hypothetical protein